MAMSSNDLQIHGKFISYIIYMAIWIVFKKNYKYK